jgi:hypothetical protein
MGVDNSVLSDLAEPKPKRHHRIAEVVFQPTIGFDQHILNHITHVNPPLDLLVQPHSDNLAQRIAVPFHQLVYSVFISLLNLQ